MGSKRLVKSKFFRGSLGIHLATVTWCFPVASCLGAPHSTWLTELLIFLYLLSTHPPRDSLSFLLLPLFFSNSNPLPSSPPPPLSSLSLPLRDPPCCTTTLLSLTSTPPPFPPLSPCPASDSGKKLLNEAYSTRWVARLCFSFWVGLSWRKWCWALEFWANLVLTCGNHCFCNAI